jgi:endonuclease/exonuclease/phosphatase family metal-dependent hydrolase
VIVGTWNVENLFRPESDGGTDDAQVYEQTLARLAQMIEQINVDVLAVEEVSDAEALEDLRRRLPGTWHAETSTFFDPQRTIRVGFLSRLELHDIEQVHAFPPSPAPVQVGDNNEMTNTMGRGTLRVRGLEDIAPGLLGHEAARACVGDALGRGLILPPDAPRDRGDVTIAP